MGQVSTIGRVLVPVADQDKAIEFYTQALGFTLTADVPYGDGDRWVEVTPPGGGAAVALVPPQGDYQPGRMTGISLGSADARADHAELAGKGVGVDEIMGGGGTVREVVNAGGTVAPGDSPGTLTVATVCEYTARLQRHNEPGRCTLLRSPNLDPHEHVYPCRTTQADGQ